MAKKIKAIVKLQIPAGQANPAPPVGPALGQHGVAIMDFCKQYNAMTKEKQGTVIPVEITIFEDRSFSFITKTPPTSVLIKKALGVEKGSKTPLKESIGTLSQEKLRQIAQEKMPDLYIYSIESAMRVVAGTARSMGIEVEQASK